MDNTYLLKWLVFLAIQLFGNTQICEVMSPHAVCCSRFNNPKEFRDATRECASEIKELIIYDSHFDYMTPYTPYLEVLIIDDCWIETAESRVFPEMNSLKKLHIINSVLYSSFPSNVFNNLSSLVTLELNNDHLYNTEYEAFQYKPGLSSLTYLSLTNNWISNLRENQFSAMGRLEDLRLEKNDIEFVEVHALAGLSSLINLNLSYNSLKYLPDGLFEGTPKLKQLDLHQNRLEHLFSSMFEGLNELNALHLQLNKLMYISDDAFNAFKRGNSLKKLYLFGNNVRSFHTNTFANLESLNELLLDDQNLLIEERGIVDNRTHQLILPFK